MDHMEFSIALPQFSELTSAGTEWINMKQRLNAHVNHSSDSYHNHVQGLVKAFLINIAAEQVQGVFNMFGLTYDEAVKFNRVMQRLEDVCLPRFIIIYNRYKFFTSKQGLNDKFDDFLRDLLNWSDNCEFGDLKDILLKDCILTGISDDSVRQNLLKTEELDLSKTLDICRTVEQEQRVANAHSNTEVTLFCDACLGTDSPKEDLHGKNSIHKSLKQLLEAGTNVTDNVITREWSEEYVSVQNIENSHLSGTLKSQFEDSGIQGEKLNHSADKHKGSEQCEPQNLSFNMAVDEKKRETNTPLPPRRSKRQKKPQKVSITCTSSGEKQQDSEEKDENHASKKLSLAFKTVINRLKHENKNTKESRKDKFLCSSCGQNFPNKHSFLSHLQQVHGKSQLQKRSLKCRVCKSVFMDLVSLRKHRQNHMGEKKFKCEMCAARFGNPSHLKVHLRLHTGERPYTCDTCGASFPESSKLKAHLRKHTGEKPYHCNICNRTFAWTAAYTRHLRTHTGERPYTCEFCGGNFADFSSLQRHRRTHTKEKPYKCDMCEARFTDPSGLKLHKRTHTGERPYSCETCGTSFARSQHLKEHVKLHTGEKPFECETCGAKFVEASKLKSHRRKHTGEKPYLCKICGTSFAWTAAYTRHMRTHTLEKPYICDFCGSHYADHSTLTRHRRTHTGERPYPCKICGTNFADNSSLHRHMRIHTGEKSYTCEVCGSSFAVKSYLIRHMRIHTGEKPYGCGTCGSKFTDSSKLNRHRKIHEKGQVRRVKRVKCKEVPQEHYQQLQPLQHIEEGDALSHQALSNAAQPTNQIEIHSHQPLTLVQDLQHPLLVTTNLLPLTNVLPFNSSIIS